jgi:hypothetical protein
VCGIRRAQIVKEIAVSIRSGRRGSVYPAHVATLVQYIGEFCLGFGFGRKRKAFSLKGK